MHIKLHLEDSLRLGKSWRGLVSERQLCRADNTRGQRQVAVRVQHRAALAAVLQTLASSTAVELCCVCLAGSSMCVVSAGREGALPELRAQAGARLEGRSAPVESRLKLMLEIYIENQLPRG